MCEINQESLSNVFDTLLFSCDDIFSMKEEECEGLTSVIQNLRERQRRVFFITSDSVYSRREIAKKLSDLKVKAADEDIISTNYLLAKYLRKQLSGGQVFVIGSEGLSEELNAAGIRNFGSGPDVLETDLATFVHTFEYELKLDAVIISFDEHLSYPKLVRATTFLNNPEVLFIATSSKQPAKAFVTCAECSAERKALIFEDDDAFRRTLCDDYSIVPQNTLLVGATLKNDIWIGKQCGFKTLLIENNGMIQDKNKTWKSKDAEQVVPDFLIQTLSEILSF